MRRIYKTRDAPRGRRRPLAQKGGGIFITLKRIAKKPLARKIAKKCLEYAPDVYHNIPKIVKNKTLKRILNSDAAHLALNKVIETVDQHLLV